MRREIKRVAEEMSAEAEDLAADGKPGEILARAEARLYAVAPKGPSDRQIMTAADAATQAITEMNEAYQRGDGLAGISTGLKDLDEKIGGLPASNLIVAAGRPGMGKSVLAINIAQHIASTGRKVAFFSLEMAPSQLSQRMLAAAVAGGKGNAFKQMTGRVSEADIAAVMEAERRIRDNLKRILIDHTPGVPIGTMHARARRLHRLHDLGLIVVDYLQLMQGAGPYGRTENRVAEVTQITNGLKAMANEFSVPVLALSQLNRKVEERDDKRPVVSDLRDSGSIEQDADTVLLLYREEEYVSKAKPSPTSDTYEADYADWSQRLERCTGKAEIIVGKSRHGPGGSVELSFDAPTQTFRDLAK